MSGLVYILIFAPAAGDAVNQIGAFAGDVLVGVFDACGSAFEWVSQVEKRGKLALLLVQRVLTSGEGGQGGGFVWP